MAKEQDIYFAQLEPFSQEFGDEVLKKIEDWYRHIETNGVFDLWVNAYDQFYSSSYSDGLLANTGDEGEFTAPSSNHFKSLLTNLHTMITSQKPSYNCVAVNSDYKSQSQTVLANNLLDWCLKEKDLEQVHVDAAQAAILLGESYIHSYWDTSKGEVHEYDENENPIHEGDIVYEHVLPIDLIRTPNKRKFEDNNWLIVRSIENKYDLVAQYEHKEKEILDCNNISDNRNLSLCVRDHIQNEEDVYVYHFYHKKTPAVPEGRYVKLVSQDAILIDTPLPYESIQVEQMKADSRMDTQFGYSVSFDLIQLQQMKDNLQESIGSNQNAFGKQSILFPEGFKGSVDDVAKGLRAIYYDPKIGLPQALQLTATPPEVFNFNNQLTQDMEVISGINSTVRGNPPKQLTSGTALAMLATQAIEFSKSLERNYVKCIERVGTKTIEIFKSFADIPRVAMLSGKSSTYQLKEFKGQDIQDIQRVFASIGSAMSRSHAGRIELAETYTTNGWVNTPQQYEMVVETGKLENVNEATIADLLNIRAENEILFDIESSEIPIVLTTDKHSHHIKQHLSILSNPVNRNNPDIVKKVLMHVQQHINELKTADPLLLQMVGEQSLAPQNQGQSVQSLPEGMTNPEQSVKQKADTVNLPNLPNAPANASPEIQEQVSEMKKRLSD